MQPKQIEGIPVYAAHDKIVDIEKVVPNPRNPNQHSDSQIELLAKIIKAQGWRAPVTVSTRSGMIVRGHGRLAAARLLNLPKVPVDYQDYATEEEEYADLIADNRLAELADLDNRMLLDLIEEIDTGEIDIELTGYTEKDIQNIIDALAGATNTVNGNEDSVPAVAEPICKLGELWELGPHRLLIGDATDPAQVKRLMGGEKAAMVFTDPPYGVSYQDPEGKFGMLANDDLTGDDLVAKLLLPAFKNMVAATMDEAAFYIWHASATRDDFSYAIKAAGLLERQYLIWVKTSATFGRADYHWGHEPCFYAGKGDRSPAFHGDRTQQTVLRASLATDKSLATTIGAGLVILNGSGQGRLYLSPKPPKGKKLRHLRVIPGEAVTIAGETSNNDVWEVANDTGTQHPTQKPVELARRAITNSSQPGDIVLDLFLGSGTTIIGAEITGRRGYGAELDPQYGSVIIQRWEEFTGRKAVRMRG